MQRTLTVEEVDRDPNQPLVESLRAHSSRRALVLGGTGLQSLGRQIALAMLGDGVRPILVGRSAEKVQQDPLLAGAEFVKADLMHLDVAEQVVQASGDLSDIAYLVVAGGGPHLRGSLADHSLAERRQLSRTVVEGPSELVAAFQAATKHSYHLITVASTSAVTIRPDETLYATAQVARRAFALNFHAELMNRPGSRNLIVSPGGMKTGLWKDTTTDPSQFMDPMVVAAVIWQMARDQTVDLIDVSLRRAQ